MDCGAFQFRPPGQGTPRALRRCPPSSRPSLSSRHYVWKRQLSDALFCRCPTLTQQLHFSPSRQPAHKLCPHCLRMPRPQLLPQRLAQRSLQLARPHPEARGSEAGGGMGSVRTVGNPALPTLGLQWGGPENKEEGSGRDKKREAGENGSAEGGHPEREEDGPSGTVGFRAVREQEAMK